MAFYRGGPCDGRPVLGELGDDRVCGGVSYSRGKDGDYHPDTSGQGAVGTAALGAHAPRGWANLQKSVNRKLPTSLHRTQAIRLATLRTINRGRRVR